MQNHQWFDAAQWFCRHFKRQSHLEAICQGLPVSQREQFSEPLFLRALQNQNFLIDRLIFEPRLCQLAPLLVEFNDELWVLLEAEENQVHLQSTSEASCYRTVSCTALLNAPVWSIQIESIADDRAKEHFQMKPKHWLRIAIEEVRPWYRDLLVGSLVINFLALVTPLFTMNVYDRVVPNAAMHTLWVLASGVVIVIFFDWLLRQARAQIGDIAGKHIDKKVSAELFAKVLGMQLEHRPQSSASFAKQIQEFDSVREFFTSATLVSAIDLPFTLIFLSLIGYLGGWMVLIPLSLMLILLFVSFVIKDKLSTAIEETSQLATQRQAHLIEHLNLLQQIKHHNAQSSAQRQWENIIHSMSDWQLRSKSLSSSMNHLLMSAQQLSSVLLVIAGVYQIFAGNLSMGGLIAIVMLSGRAGSSINQLTMLILRYQQCRSAIDSLETTMSLPQENNQKSSVTGDFLGQISINQLNFNYPQSEQRVLQGVCLKVNAGEKVALLGVAGSGKSTLLALIARQYQVDYGSIQYDGLDAHQWPIARLRQAIGYMPQMPLLYFGTIMENIIMGLDAVSKPQLTHALNNSGVTTFIQHLPEGLDTQVGELGRNLSGGQRQAILLARTFMNQPKVMVLDEPTSFMDSIMKRQVIQNLKKSTATIFIATHDTELIAMCDKRYHINQGEIVSLQEGKAKKRAHVSIQNKGGHSLKLTPDS